MYRFFVLVAVLALALAIPQPKAEQQKKSCSLKKDDSVVYRCVLPGSNGTRVCGESEPDGTVVHPQCNAPNYYSSGVLNCMHCIDGSWDYVAQCTPECGQVGSDGRLPWHALIYKKGSSHQRLCSGALVSTKAVITAAHCVTSSDPGKVQPASTIAVALGKTHQEWEHEDDVDAQKFDVERILVPPRYRGHEANFQEDIAILILSEPVTLQRRVSPVCLNFDVRHERLQLKDGSVGEVSVLNSPPSEKDAVVKVASVSYLPIDQCLTESPPGFRPYITSDKICVRTTNGTAICRGDSGAGVAFPTTEAGTLRYYLRGISSVAARKSIDSFCDVGEINLLTQVSKHEQFIKEFIL